MLSVSGSVIWIKTSSDQISICWLVRRCWCLFPYPDNVSRHRSYFNTKYKWGLNKQTRDSTFGRVHRGFALSFQVENNLIGYTLNGGIMWKIQKWKKGLLHQQKSALDLLFTFLSWFCRKKKSIFLCNFGKCALISIAKYVICFCSTSNSDTSVKNV